MAQGPEARTLTSWGAALEFDFIGMRCCCDTIVRLRHLDPLSSITNRNKIAGQALVAHQLSAISLSKTFTPTRAFEISFWPAPYAWRRLASAMPAMHMHGQR
jgi:hypothetical protein